MDFVERPLSALMIPLLAAVFASCSGPGVPPEEPEERSVPFEAPQAVPAGAPTEEPAEPLPELTGTGLYSLRTTTLDGDPINLARFQGKVALVVNIATQSVHAPQIDELQELHQDFASKGFEVLAFPCDDFGHEEPGSASEIAAKLEDRVTYPVLEKVRIRVGRGQSPVFRWLGNQAGTLPTWNFSKYLVGRDGEVLRYFSSDVKPSGVELRTSIAAAVQGAKLP